MNFSLAGVSDGVTSTGVTTVAAPSFPLVPVAAGAGAAVLLILAICMAALISCVCCCCSRYILYNSYNLLVVYNL